MHGAGERRRDLEDEALQLEVELGQSADQERRAAQEADRAERTIRGLEDEERSLAEQEGLPVEGATAVVRGNLTAFEAAADRDGREARDTGRRLEVLHAQLEAEAHETERLREEIRAMDTETEVARKRYEAAAAARTVEQATWQQAEEDANEAKLAVAAARARAEALENAAAGLADPQARELTAGKEGVVGTLASLLDIPERLAPAVDAALGAWSDALAVESADQILDAVADLKAKNLGGIPLVTAYPGDSRRSCPVGGRYLGRRRPRRCPRPEGRCRSGDPPPRRRDPGGELVFGLEDCRPSSGNPGGNPGGRPHRPDRRAGRQPRRGQCGHGRSFPRRFGRC